MNDTFDISRLLVLRKITRAISDLLRNELKTHLATLFPLLHPRGVFGQYARGSEKQSVKGDSEAFDELRNLYMSLAAKGPLGLPKQLDPPLDIMNTPPELHPAEYSYVAKSDQQSKTVLVSSPLKWALAFSGFEPKRLRELIGIRKTATGSDVQQCVLQFLAMHVTLSKRPGITRLLESLRFSVNAGRAEEFGDLPLTYIGCAVSTLRPPDEVIIQSTEISGMPAFEEVVNLDDLVNLRDPLKERLSELVRNHDEKLLPK